MAENPDAAPSSDPPERAQAPKGHPGDVAAAVPVAPPTSEEPTTGEKTAEQTAAGTADKPADTTTTDEATTEEAASGENAGATPPSVGEDDRDGDGDDAESPAGEPVPASTHVAPPQGAAAGYANGRPVPRPGYGYPSSDSTPTPPYGWGPPRLPPPQPPRVLPPTPRWLLPAVLGVGLVAVVSVPNGPVGLGLVIAAGAGGLVLVRGARPRWSGWSLAFAGVASALVLVAVVRDAAWVVWPSLLTAFALVSLTMSGAGRHWFGAVRGGLAPLLVLPWAPRFLLTRPEGVRERRQWGPVLVGVAVTVPLVGLFGLLFASADPMFAHVVSEAFDWSRIFVLPFKVFVFLTVAVLVPAAVLAAREPVVDPAGGVLEIHMPRVVWVIPLVTLNLLFVAFVAVQANALFGGDEWVQSTTGLNYAEYAREGFFQLVTVCAFVLGIVAVAWALVPRERRADRRLLLALLGLLCCLTLVVLASAWHRIDLYTDAFALTRMRAAVGATILWIGALFALLLTVGTMSLLGRGTAWLPRAAVLTTAAGVALFAAWNPDARIAESQVARDSDTVDTWYVDNLSADAVPALVELPASARLCALQRQSAALEEPDGWSSWNHARQRARDTLVGVPVRPVDPVDCPSDRWDSEISRYE